MSTERVPIMEDVLLINAKCCLCTKNFTNPRYLPSCLHTFCSKCVEDAGKMKGYSAGQDVPCPVCGIESFIPTEGFDKLPENPFVSYLIEGDNKEFVSKTCEACLKNGDIEGSEETVAENYCINCEESLCLVCTQEHKKNNHLTAGMTKPEGVDKNTKEQKHDLEETEVRFCSSCTKIVCGHCLQEPHGPECPGRWIKNKRMRKDGEAKESEEDQNKLQPETENIQQGFVTVDHSSHDCLKLNECSVTFRKMAQIIKDEASDMIGDIRRKGLKIRTEKMNFLEQMKTMELQILKRSEEMKELICNETKKLLGELATVKRTRLAEIDGEQRKMEKHLFTFEMFKKRCEEIKNLGSDREVCVMDDTLQSTLNRMRNELASRIEYGIPPLKLSFSTKEKEKFVQTDNNIVGCIEVVFPIYLELASTIDQPFGKGQLRGIAKLKDKLYVLSDEITVFQSQSPFARLGEINIPAEGSSLVDIASCRKSSCLYVSNTNSACVWRITSDHRVIRWMSNDTKSFGLSVCQSGQVMMIEGIEGQSPFYLNFYETSARRSRRVPLSPEIKSVRCIYESPSGNFFIGYGASEIFKLTLDGQIIVRQQLSSVQCLQFTDYHLFLGVGNYNMYILDSKLASQQVSLPNDPHQGYRILTKMCYIPETKQLAVLFNFSHPSYANYSRVLVCNVLAKK